MLPERILDTYCGLKCYVCEYKENNNCSGCIATKGNPFYGKCEAADCVISKGKRFCGECENFPCELLKNHSFDKKRGDNGERIEYIKMLVLDKNISVGEIIACKGKPIAQIVNTLTQEELDELI